MAHPYDPRRLLGQLPDGTGAQPVPPYAPGYPSPEALAKVQADARLGDELRGIGCSPEQLCLAKAIVVLLLEGLRRNPTSYVRMPESCAAPHDARLRDFGLKDAAVSIAAGATATIVSGTFTPEWYSWLTAFAWSAAWEAENPTATTSAFDSLEVSLLIAGNPHPDFNKVARNAGPIRLDPPWPVPPAAAAAQGASSGPTVALVGTNTHGTESILVAGRIQAYSYPSSGAGQGARGATTPEG